MCIYCTTTNYRKIYENHIGTIPREATGRTYEIHHIDGNHTNNDPTNLTAVTLQEHNDIHYAQGDYPASMIMKLQRILIARDLIDRSRIPRSNMKMTLMNSKITKKQPTMSKKVES